MDRRAFLTRSAVIGCSLAASPLITPVSFAAAPGDARLVVILLRGGMDGLGTVIPYGDPGYAALRPGSNPLDDGGLDLDGRFGLHPGLTELAPLWEGGELSFIHAVSTPYRDKRSHFDGQDVLEAGVSNARDPMPSDGWLNRLIQSVPDTNAETAYAVGSDPLRILDGSAPVSRWTPEADLFLSPQAIRLTEFVMRSDPEMAAALQAAYSLSEGDGDSLAFSGGADSMMATMKDDLLKPNRGGGPGVALARFAGEKLRGSSRIACYSLTGWDTHKGQDRALARALKQLQQSLLTLKETLGPAAWEQTAVVAVTEFGRTARWNGTGGTDHGTGGAAILAGGAVRGGRVIADWPGLAEADLYQRRDLMPTRDLRAHLAWLLQGLFGLDRDTLERSVFPGVDMGADPGLLL